MTAAVLRHLLDLQEHHVLKRAGTYDLRVVDGSCGPLDEDVWDRVVALRRETQDEQTAGHWREWAQALRAGVDGGLVRLLLVMDGPRLVWFAAVTVDGAVSLTQPLARTRAAPPRASPASTTRAGARCRWPPFGPTPPTHRPDEDLT